MTTVCTLGYRAVRSSDGCFLRLPISSTALKLSAGATSQRFVAVHLTVRRVFRVKKNKINPADNASLRGNSANALIPYTEKCPDGARYYRKLARKQQQIWFGRVDASSNPELARDLGLKAVPSFVTFRGGEVVTATSTSSKAKIEKLVDELLYE